MPNERIQNIALELSGDPESLGYTGTAAAKAAAMNAVGRPAPVPATSVARYLQLAGKWAAIADAAADYSLSAEKRQAARALVDALATFEDFDLTDPLVSAVVTGKLDDLIAQEFLATTDKAAILTLGNNQRSRAQELGVGKVTERDIVLAGGA